MMLSLFLYVISLAAAAAGQSCTTGAVFHGGGFLMDNSIANLQSFTMETFMYIDNLDISSVVMWLDVGNIRYRSNGRGAVSFTFAVWESRQGGTESMPHLTCQVPANVNYRLPFHVAGVASGSDLRLYFNGIEAIACSTVGNNPGGTYLTDVVGGHSCSTTGTGTLSCGVRGSDIADNELFYGWLKWPRVWSTVRTGDQIAQTMNADVPADANGLVAAWNFAEASFEDGGAVPDITGGHNGRFSFRSGAVHCDIPSLRVSQHVVDLLEPLRANISTQQGQLSAMVMAQASAAAAIQQLAGSMAAQATAQAAATQAAMSAMAASTSTAMATMTSSTAASQSTMLSNVAQLSGTVSTQAATITALRSALLAAAAAAPSRPGVGAERTPHVQADGFNIAIKAPVGAVSIQSDGCEISDLCTATAFAENLKAELSNMA